MKSSHVDAFNHDAEAPGYDADIRNEDDPIRTGYAELLDWVAARVSAGARVCDLGSGTGNLGARLPEWRELVCVDVSAAMTEIAREKLASRGSVEFVSADLLEYFDSPPEPFDAVVSTYAIHHLTDDEKDALFERIAACLTPSGRVAFGDLMFPDAGTRAALLKHYKRSGQSELVAAINEEFFWDLWRTRRTLERLGFELEIERFSDLSWAIAGQR